MKQKAQPVTQWPESALYDEGGDHVHFALYVDDSEFDTSYEFLQQVDVPVTKREYAAEAPYQLLYFKDPDEHVIELYTRPMEEDYQLNNVYLVDSFECR